MRLSRNTQRNTLFLLVLLVLVIPLNLSCANIYHKNGLHKATESDLHGKYLDTLTHECAITTNLVFKYYAKRMAVDIKNNEFRLEVNYDRGKSEIIQGRVFRSLDTIILVLDSSNLWGKIPSLKAKYLFKDSILDPVLQKGELEDFTYCLPGCQMNIDHKFIKTK
jgi:hypothetical protein